jgi:phosphatidylglycerophosphate synthase
MAGGSPDRTAPLLVVGAVLWQVAYIFDCADGQVARATGKTSADGESVDVFVDVAVQISVVAAVSSVILSRHEIPGLLVVLFVAAWCANLNFLNNFLRRLYNRGGHSLIARYSGPVSVTAETLRDYGFVILMLGAWLLVSPSTLFIPVMAVTANNLVLLVGYIARAAYRSVRVSRQVQNTGNRVLAPLEPLAVGLTAGDGPSPQGS